jgi:hypothetical protein
MASRDGILRATPYAPANPPCPRRYPLTHATVSSRLFEGINMVHQTQKGLPEPGDYRPGSWLDVVGLLVALVGLALVVGTTLTM